MRLIFIFIICYGCSHVSKIKSSFYKREEFKHWIDSDGDCQNTRDEILIRDSLMTPKFKTKKMCKVISGKWKEPYTYKIFYQAKDLDIDHIVPLSHAFYNGASKWNKKLKQDFANDPENLLAVSAHENRNKKDKPPHRWMPSNKKFHCEYIEKWIFVKQKYKLDITVSEANYLNSKRQSCP
jgi:hypothetical protein